MSVLCCQQFIDEQTAFLSHAAGAVRPSKKEVSSVLISDLMNHAKLTCCFYYSVINVILKIN